MQNLKARRPDEAVVDSDKETLDDLVKNEKISDSESEGAGGESRTPAPDGALDKPDESRSKTGEEGKRVMGKG